MPSRKKHPRDWHHDEDGNLVGYPDTDKAAEHRDEEKKP
jgi:hypothetical protein